MVSVATVQGVAGFDVEAKKNLGSRAIRIDSLNHV